MEQNVIDLLTVTGENVWNLTEEQVARLVFHIQSDAVAKADRPAYIRIINSAFDFRTVSASRRDLRNSLTMLGFQLFKEHETDRHVFGVCRKKRPGKSFYE